MDHEQMDKLYNITCQELINDVNKLKKISRIEWEPIMELCIINGNLKGLSFAYHQNTCHDYRIILTSYPPIDCGLESPTNYRKLVLLALTQNQAECLNFLLINTIKYDNLSFVNLSNDIKQDISFECFKVLINNRIIKNLSATITDCKYLEYAISHGCIMSNILDYAVEQNNMDIINLLIEKESKMDITYALNYAIDKDNLTLVEQLWGAKIRNPKIICKYTKMREANPNCQEFMENVINEYINNDIYYITINKIDSILL